MDFKFNYNTEKERSNILKENEHLYLKKDAELLNEKYLILTDVEPEEPKLTEIELMQEKISILEAENEKLKVEQEQQNEEILVNMLANTEMFEIILGMMPMTLSIDEKNTKNSGGNRGICDIYASLIEKGVKTINDVPVQIVEQVKNKLEL